MTFQSTIRYDLGYGVPGEIRKQGPLRSYPSILNSADPTQNIVGRAVSYVAGSPGVVQAGNPSGTAVFAGILANPKVYASRGDNAGNPLAPTLLLPNNTEVEHVAMGFIVVQLSGGTTANVGDDVHYVEATGALLAVAPGTAPATGNLKVPNAQVDEVPQAVANGLALIRITN